ncbi:hypothetical protein DFAR_630057 [Desulfarculales bacterium]
MLSPGSFSALTGLYPGTLQAILRRARNGRRQFLKGRPHQTHKKIGPGGPSPRTARRNPSSSSRKPPSVGFKSWPSCTPALSFRKTPILPFILASQNDFANLLILIYRASLPLASRVVARSHLAGVSLQDMQNYLLQHHRKIAGVKQKFFSDLAIIAIQQGSSGLFRRANNLA